MFAEGAPNNYVVVPKEEIAASHPFPLALLLSPPSIPIQFHIRSLPPPQGTLLCGGSVSSARRGRLE